ncbi:MAG: hypothetical protein QG629_287 [Patescibacteria group bacterium]|nr:DUF3048 domain-containing protein [Candidatus Saccharibacteria bacterium]MDQ5963205.1 hypothetical protein [Patescibacteria group bacterium]
MDENKNGWSGEESPKPQDGQVFINGEVQDIPKKTAWRPTQNQIKIAAIALVIAVLGVGGWFALQHTSPAKSPIATKKTAPKPTTVASNLTGLQVDPSVNQRPVTGVMIENSLEARPQSGLDQAGVVFEAIAEGGITRHLALYQDSEPDYLGPVRSVRPYYAQWCMGFDCTIAHVGGSPEALSNIQTWGVKDLDQFVHDAAYWRIPSRYAPHNMYTSTAKLREVQAAKGYSAGTFTPLARKADAPSQTPNARSININISSASFNSHYDWDAASNTYRRSLGGEPHMNVNSAGAAAQISPKVVVAMVMPYGVALDKHSSYGTIGSGQAYVFQDGIVTEGTWNKADMKTQFSFVDGAGKPIALNAGQTWFVALGGSGNLNYQ